MADMLSVATLIKVAVAAPLIPNRGMSTRFMRMFIMLHAKNIFLRAIWQYKDYRRNIELYEEEEDPETRKLFSQFLFSYKLNPQTVFFLGYSDDYYGDIETDFTQTNRTFFAKIGYAFVLWIIFVEKRVVPGSKPAHSH